MKIINFINKHKKKIWWTILFICSLLYIYMNLSTIANKSTDVDKLVIAISIVLAFLPLVNEFSFAGISVKREIETVKNELKTEVQKVKFEIMQFSLNNSLKSDIRIDIGNEVLPSKETIKNDLSLTNENDSQEKYSNIFGDVSDNAVILFKARYLIEQRVYSIANKYGVDYKKGLNGTSKSLLNAELINSRTYQYISKVLAICNRGIHGEIIDEYYIDYVRKILPEILDGLSVIRFQEMANTFHKCKNCGFSRISDFELKCPECGLILDEY